MGQWLKQSPWPHTALEPLLHSLHGSTPCWDATEPNSAPAAPALPAAWFQRLQSALPSEKHPPTSLLLLPPPCDAAARTSGARAIRDCEPQRTETSGPPSVHSSLMRLFRAVSASEGRAPALLSEQEPPRSGLCRARRVLSPTTAI